jgi:hypothetical protein
MTDFCDFFGMLKLTDPANYVGGGGLDEDAITRLLVRVFRAIHAAETAIEQYMQVLDEAAMENLHLLEELPFPRIHCMRFELALGIV